jgi:hypothetical protein
MEAKWMWDGSKSMEHARRNGIVTEALMPLGGKPEGLLPLGGKSERLLPPIAKQPQDVIGDVITLDWWTVHNWSLEKLQLNPFAITFAISCPFPEKYI